MKKRTIILTAIVIGGICYMVKNKSEGKKKATESKGGLRGALVVLVDKAVAGAKAKKIFLRTDSGEEVPNTEKLSGRKKSGERSSSKKLSEPGEMVELEQEAVKLAQEILDLEWKETRYRTLYYATQEIRQAYLKEAGIKEVLDSILKLQQYLPEGLRGDKGNGETIPLHSAVWNTYLHTLKRKDAELAVKCKTLSEANCAKQPIFTEEQTEEVLAGYPQAYKEYKELGNSKVKEKDKDGAERKVVALCKEIQQLRSRKKAAEESIERYRPLVDEQNEQKVENAIAFCEAFDGLLSGSACEALKTFEPCGAEPVTVEMDGDDVVLSATVKAYWDKVCVFADEIQTFVRLWDKTGF